MSTTEIEITPAMIRAGWEAFPVPWEIANEDADAMAAMIAAILAAASKPDLDEGLV